MANADTVATASDRLLELVGCLERQEGFAEVVESLKGGHAATLDGVWGSSCALAAAALAAHAPATLVVVCPHVDQVDELIDDLALFTRLEPERFPAWESPERAVHDEVFGQRRASAAASCCKAAAARRSSSVASIQSLLQPVPSRETLGRQTRSLRVGDTMAVEELAKWLVENGLVNTPAVELPGEFSVRGGIVDIFAPDWDWPVRVEFFGDEIESIRRFEISSQRSLESLEAVDVTIVGAGHRPTAPIWPTICRRKAGSCCWSRWSWSRGAAVFGADGGADAGAAVDERPDCGRRQSPHSPHPSGPFVPHRFRSLEAGVPLSLGGRLGRGHGVAGNHLPAEDRIGRALQRRHQPRARRIGRGRRRARRCSSSARPRPRSAGCGDIFGATQAAQREPLALPHRHAAKRFPAGARSDRAA